MHVIIFFGTLALAVLLFAYAMTNAAVIECDEAAGFLTTPGRVEWKSW